MDRSESRDEIDAYLKSPSLYFPKACRMTVTMAIRGFTTQNCSVACGHRPEKHRRWASGRSYTHWCALITDGSYLFTESEEPDRIGSSPKAACSVNTAGPGEGKEDTQGLSYKHGL